MHAQSWSTMASLTFPNPHCHGPPSLHPAQAAVLQAPPAALQQPPRPQFNPVHYPRSPCFPPAFPLLSALQAPQAGEVVCFKIDDGAPTMYNEVIVELAPFFGGHIIGGPRG